MKKNIVLVGFMGTGKTTVAQLLAQKTGMPLVDMDSLIEQRAGKPITEIFATEGEAHFRALEHSLALELAETSGQIISTGGGIVLNPKNTEALGKTGLEVCLLARPETILKRLRNDQSRPLLSGNKEEQIAQLLQQRAALYEAIPHTLQTDELTPEQIAQQIYALYKTNT